VHEKVGPFVVESILTVRRCSPIEYYPHSSSKGTVINEGISVGTIRRVLEYEYARIFCVC